MEWYKLTSEDALKTLNADALNGLSSADVVKRKNKYGLNELIEKEGRTKLQILWEQLTATMVLILIASAILAGLLGDFKNAIAIGAIVLLYSILGFIQEYRTGQAIAALKKLSVPNVRVIRDATVREISAVELVPGDVIQLEQGNLIPADVRLLETVNLRVQEAALTGESEPIEKHAGALLVDSPALIPGKENLDLPLGDRRNMGYMGTIVTQGRGTALVVSTGMQTELGKIAGLIQQVPQEQTPLQRRLDALGRVMAVIGLVIAGLIFLGGFFRGDDIRHLLLTAVSVAVAVVPEGLPAVVTITLALGAQRMLSRKALIRRLPAVETLGSVTVICSDKTGTLTENKMTVVVMDVAGSSLDLSEDMSRDGSIKADLTHVPAHSGSLTLLALGGALCNDVRLIAQEHGSYHTLGDPTEGAMVVASARLGLWKNELEQAFLRINEIPFDSDRKRMTTVHHIESDHVTLKALNGINRVDPPHAYVAFTKGSVDGLLEISTHVWVDGKSLPLNEAWRKKIETANISLAGKGMRVLGVAMRYFSENPVPALLESGLTFIGMYGMIDPPRQEVKSAVGLTKSAGIRTVMITGDHSLTAVEIARQLGISENGRVVTGSELEAMTSDQLRQAVKDVDVFARVSPEHKIRIVQALQDNGHIVSMTGDGVNDAPALKRANIGVAMGITGTDVAKEASDLVLLDDNFATIVSAVKEGRTIYDNIRKFVRFGVAGNIGKVLVMLVAPFIGNPVPLLPLQLLWLNLLTDGLLGLGIGVEKSEKNTMQRPPYLPGEGVFSRGAGFHTVAVGMLIGGLVIGLGYWYLLEGNPAWQTMMFTTIAFAQVGQAFASRSNHELLAEIGIRSNKLLLIMAVLVMALQLFVIYIPSLAAFFVVVPLSLVDLSLAVACGFLVFGLMEMVKLLERTKK